MLILDDNFEDFQRKYQSTWATITHLNGTKEIVQIRGIRAGAGPRNQADNDLGVKLQNEYIALNPKSTFVQGMSLIVCRTLKDKDLTTICLDPVEQTRNGLRYKILLPFLDLVPLTPEGGYYDYEFFTYRLRKTIRRQYQKGLGNSFYIIDIADFISREISYINKYNEQLAMAMQFQHTLGEINSNFVLTCFQEPIPKINYINSVLNKTRVSAALSSDFMVANSLKFGNTVLIYKDIVCGEFTPEGAYLYESAMWLDNLFVDETGLQITGVKHV